MYGLQKKLIRRIPFFLVIGLIGYSVIRLQHAAYAAPLLKIVSPTDGQTVVSHEVTVSFVVGNAQFGTETLLHLWLDTPDPTQENATLLTSHLDHVLSDIAPGPHTLTLEAIKPNRTPFEPRVLQTVTFTVSLPVTQESQVISPHNPLVTYLNQHLEQLAGALTGMMAVGIGFFLWRKART